MNRCMCPKPEGAIFSYPGWKGEATIRFSDNVLHFKKSDRYCERCGRGLCGDCGTLNGFSHFETIPMSGGKLRLVDEYYCFLCAEDERMRITKNNEEAKRYHQQERREMAREK